MTDIVQQRCGNDGCIAWRLSVPGSGGQQRRPCWRPDCHTAEAPVGDRYGERCGERDG